MLPACRPLTRPPSDRCQQVFNLLLDVNKACNVGVTLRVAGGWVRDQLLGFEAHDVDIAIETPLQPGGEGQAEGGAPSTSPTPLVTGEVFAHHIATYQKERSLELSTISVIRTNPEKSKHIETAQMTLFGLPIEFCHLRADDYCAKTRIPVIRPGTPREDALRRDFTVNSLFYNLHTQMVEDFTGSVVEGADGVTRVVPGQGFADMEKKVLRCPLAPLETFMDDPLRLLRGVRFAGQLGYDLDESVTRVVAEHGKDIIPAIQQKLSRERIGIEVTKMFGGKDPTRCLTLLHETKLLYTTLLVEHYYVMTKGEKIQIGGPTKGCPTPTRVEFTLSTPEASLLAECRAASAEAGVPVQSPPSDVVPQLQADFEVTSTEVLRRGTEWFRAATAVIPLPLGEVRMECSFFTFLPILLQGPSFPDTLISDPKNRNEIHRYRINAILTHSMKLPIRVSNTIGKMMEASDILTPHWTALVAAALTGGGVASGSPREALFFALKCLKDESGPVVDFVCAMQSMVLTNGGAAWVEQFNAIKAMIKADTDLTNLVVQGPTIKGNALTKALGVTNKEIGRTLEMEQTFLIHNPKATEDEILSYLRTQLRSDSPPQ